MFIARVAAAAAAAAAIRFGVKQQTTIYIYIHMYI